MDTGSKAGQENWDLVIEPRSSIFQLPLKELWNYRYLLVMFVKRDIVSVYKQTVLGPVWFFIQPILTTITFVVVFGSIAKISTDGLPQILFYLAGITIWNYFSETLSATSNTFIVNASIFGKVYFPRLILPLSKVISGLIKFGIQFLLFALTLIYFLLKGSSVHPNIWEILIFTPVILIIMGGLGLGLGLILSAMTTKYRDLNFLISFGIQLGMYATPVIYPLSAIHSKYKKLVIANPMSSLVETFRKIYLGNGELSLTGLVYSMGCSIIILFFGIIIFNKVEKTFMDTV
jgi:lipopolysaccharide transport system permease protein